jgi:carbonic anhydrase
VRVPLPRMPWITLHPDLGVRALIEDARGWSRATLLKDALAGLTILGPSLAIALLVAQHGGLSIVAVLACVVVGSLIVALLGGTKFGLSGPGLAIGFALLEVARSHGPSGLALACALTGVFQLVLGVLGIGRYARLLPITVVHAFTFGIGALLVVRCLPQALGIDTPADLDVAHAIDHLGAHIGESSWPALLMAAVAVAAMLVRADRTQRYPVALLVIVLASVATGVASLNGITLDVPTLAVGPVAWAMPPLPASPTHDVAQFVASVVVLFMLATAETLLSATADEQLAAGTRNNLDQEMIGHGIANGVLSLCGGVLASGSILRASAMRRAGVSSRATAVVHAVLAAMLLPLVLFAAQFVPLAVLAGVVIALAAPLLDLSPLRAVARVSVFEAIVLAVTGFTVVFVDLLTAIEVALIATLILAMLRVARFRSTLATSTSGNAHQINFSGPITFLAVPELDRTRERLEQIDTSVGVILDIRSVLAVDVTGCVRFLTLIGELVDKGGPVAVLGASPSCRKQLLAADHRKLLDARMAVSDREVDTIIGQARSFEMRAHVIANLERFRQETREHYSPLFDQLAEGQSPHTLFVTCVDSRISPTMFTGAHPGELFILRCLGAIVAAPGGDSHAEGAAVEYALSALGVRNIVVCGHSQCGAIKAIKNNAVPEGCANLERWLAGITQASGEISNYLELDDAARAVTVRQLANLQQFPVVAEHLADGRLKLMAWFYDVGKADLFEWDEASHSFRLLADYN